MPRIDRPAAPLTHLATAERRVYLTFDDGPDPQWTPRLLDVLATAGVQATFFMVGSKVRAHPELARRVAAAGHHIGNHTYSHKHPWLLSRAAARTQVRCGAIAIADTLGRRPLFFRPPHGRLRTCMVEEAADFGEATVLWTRSAMDWGPLAGSERIAARLARAVPGDIVLMHDGANQHNRPWALMAVLPAVLREYAESRLLAMPLPLPV